MRKIIIVIVKSIKVLDWVGVKIIDSNELIIQPLRRSIVEKAKRLILAIVSITDGLDNSLTI